MVRFAQKRLQVFVSSTYTDLLTERQAAVEAILVAGHIPAGMELFAASDETQMEVIRQWIDESDIYLLIVGGRYGAVHPISGKSYTQLEYEYAVDKGKPLFACVMRPEALETKVKRDGINVMELEEPQKLRQFKELVLSKIVRFWDDPKDIKIAIGETLASFSRRDDLIGWVRADSAADVPALTDEFVRMSRENADLRARLDRSGTEEAIEGVSYEQLKYLLVHKGILEPFHSNKSSFFSPMGYDIDEGPPELIKELEQIGLVSPRNGGMSDFYNLTDSGRKFLNRYELDLLRDLPV